MGNQCVSTDRCVAMGALSCAEYQLPSGSLAQPLLIVDRGEHCVMRLDPDSDMPLNTDAGMRGHGRGPRQLAGPRGIAVDGCGNFIVAESLNSRTSRWSHTVSYMGETVAGIDGAGSGPEQLESPSDVAYDSCGNAVIVDSLNHRVIRLCPDDVPQRTTSLYSIPCAEYSRRRPLDIVAGGRGKGDGMGQLCKPLGITIDANDNVYVSEEGNHRVTRWSPNATEGVVVAGGHGPGADLKQLNAPRGITLDNSGRLLIADSQNHRVVRWALDAKHGEVVAGGCGDGKDLKHLSQPSYVLVEPSGALLVSESGIAARVSRWWAPEQRAGPADTSGKLVVGNGKLKSPWGLAFVPPVELQLDPVRSQPVILTRQPLSPTKPKNFALLEADCSAPHSTTMFSASKTSNRELSDLEFSAPFSTESALGLEQLEQKVCMPLVVKSALRKDSLDISVDDTSVSSRKRSVSFSKGGA